jgi:hypothetical protein
MEESHGANDLDSQARGREKARGGWNGLYLPAPVSGVNAEWQAHEGQGLEPVAERQRERWQHLPGAILRFVWKELQQRQCENGERARTGIRKPLLAGLTPGSPMKREPKRHPFINRAFEQGGGLTYSLFPKCRSKGIAQVTNHLMGRHASPTALTLRAHPVQSVEHFFAVRHIEESFHSGKVSLHISK